jgi:cyanate permease
MAGATLAIGLPASLLVGTADRPAPGERHRGRFEANRQTLMLLLIAFLLGLIVAGLIVHLVPLLIDRGMAATEAAQTAAIVGVAVLAARLVVGYLFDRFHAPYVAALFLLSPVVAALLLWGGGPVTIAALMLGLAAGAEVDMLAYFTGRYAALANYGATYGGVLGIFCLGAGLGPMLFGAAHDGMGGYDAALLGSALVLSLVVVLIATLGRYRNDSIPSVCPG